MLRAQWSYLSKGYATAWGRILGRNWDNSLKSFPPCYSQSPLQLCLEISISSNSRNLLQFLYFSYCTLKRRNEENLIETIPPSIQKPQVWELSRLCPETSTKLYVHELGFWAKSSRPESYANYQYMILGPCNLMKPRQWGEFWSENLTVYVWECTVHYNTVNRESLHINT